MADTLQPALFGKHPAWADHMTDYGGNGAINTFRQHFYIDGIGTCLARQKWGPENPHTPLPWHHALLTITQQNWVLAAIDASRDSRGRTHYPLVATTSGQDPNTLASLPTTGTTLTSLLTAAAAATDEASVTAAFQSWAAGPPLTSSPLTAAATFLDTLSPDPTTRDAVARIFHALAPQASGDGRARIPIIGPEFRSAAHWASLIRYVLEEDATTLTILWERGSSHADITLGPPDARTLSDLFGPQAHKTLTTTIPFTIDAPFATACAEASLAWTTTADWLQPITSPTPQKSFTLKGLTKLFSRK